MGRFLVVVSFLSGGFFHSNLMSGGDGLNSCDGVKMSFCAFISSSHETKGSNKTGLLHATVSYSSERLHKSKMFSTRCF